MNLFLFWTTQEENDGANNTHYDNKHNRSDNPPFEAAHIHKYAGLLFHCTDIEINV